MTALVCFTMDNLSDAADLGRGHIPSPRKPGQRPGLETGFPALLDLFGRFEVTVTHFLEGWNGEAHPEAVRELVERGHRVGMHGWQHERWAELDRGSVFELAKRASDALEQACGVRPDEFRAPGGKRSRYCAKVMRELGYHIDASLDVDGSEVGGVRRLEDSLWTAPFYWEAVDATHWLWRHESPGEVERRWRTLLERTAADHGYQIFIWHPHVMGVDSQRLGVGERILEYVTGNEAFRVVTLGELVRHYQQETI